MSSFCIYSMRGILSEAMVMCAFTTDPETSQFIDPPPGSVIGERINFEGYEGVFIYKYRNFYPYCYEICVAYVF